MGPKMWLLTLDKNKKPIIIAYPKAKKETASTNKKKVWDDMIHRRQNKKRVKASIW